jgi:hypothetical protein
VGAAEQRYQARVVRRARDKPLGVGTGGSIVACPAGGTIPRLARAIYDEPRFEDLTVLADALEEAGCTDRRILSHCRQEEEHVRGCWVLDLLLKRT